MRDCVTRFLTATMLGVAAAVGVTGQAATVPPLPFAETAGQDTFTDPFPELAAYERNLPRVLYSWTDQKKLNSMIRQFTGQPGFATAVYATRTPLSSFMYGPILVRIKLRPGPFQSRDAEGDRYFNIGSANNTIITHMRQINLAPLELREYVLEYFRSDIVESFSYATADIVSEIAMELKLIEDPNRYHMDLAFRNRGRPILLHPEAPTMDGNAWTPAILQQRLNETRSFVANNFGKVFYAPDVDPKKSPHFTPSDMQKQMVSGSIDKSTIASRLKQSGASRNRSWHQ